MSTQWKDGVGRGGGGTEQAEQGCVQRSWVSTYGKECGRKHSLHLGLKQSAALNRAVYGEQP